MEDLKKEINKRRTFAIISHPDAGKTTLTEKLLLYGGAIRLAGSVKSRKAQKHAVSDWMEIEKERGISVTSSVMQFNYDGYCINILDTPGHQDFSEDTYRTLMAADSAVMVVDASKGVEEQTKKLFHVCSLRNIPIFTIVNKMDREAKDPFELMDEIREELGIDTYPMNWPIGSGKEFKGVYERESELLYTFDAASRGQKTANSHITSIHDEKFNDFISKDMATKLQNDIELLDIAGDEFDKEKVSNGELSPMFFASALTNFGIEPFLKDFLSLTSAPLPRKTSEGKKIEVFSEDFSAFVFKIQANLNPAHRDRIAFLRITSGKFEKDMMVHHYEQDKNLKLSQPQSFLAQDREMVESAYAGDIIGIFDPGIYSIGDTLTSTNNIFKFEGIPSFAPEHFYKIRPVDTIRRKQFVKGINQVAQEGAVQLYRENHIGMEEIIIGVVGTLQMDVLKYRLKNEYTVEINVENLPFNHVRWIEDNKTEIDSLNLTSDTKLVKDTKERNILLFQNPWSISWALEHNKGLLLSDVGKVD